MSPALPVVSGAAVVVALAKVGYEQVSQRGSHVKLRTDGRTVIVPLSRDEVEKLIADAIPLHIQSLREHGEPVPHPTALGSTKVQVP